MFEIIIYGIISGFAIGLLALAFQLNYKIYKIFDLSQAGIFVCSTYMFLFIKKILIKGDSYLELFVSLLITCFLSWLLSFLIHKFIFKLFFKNKSSSLNFLIVSLATYMLLVNLIVIIFGTDIQIINIPEISFNSFMLFSLVFTKIQIIQVLVFVFSILALYYILVKSKIGLQITAISDNESLFSLQGYDIYNARNKTLLISSSLIAIVSVTHSIEFGIDPNTTGFQMLLQGVVAMIIGGSYSYKGAILGGIFIGVLSNLGSYFFSGNWEEAITFIILLTVLFIKKNGLFSVKLRVEK